MASNIIEIENLSKKYGKIHALNGVNLTLKEGRLLGLLGPNGSGKTTLIKIMMGLIKPDSGRIKIDGKNIGVDTKRIISYLPDQYHLYDNLSIKDAINLYSDFYKDFSLKVCKDLMDFMQVPQIGYAEKLSKGMKERLLLSLTLARKTKLYILDEPIDGVDPGAKEMILNAIIKTIDIGRTIVITTHQVKDLENLFDEVALIRDGKIIAKEDAEKVREQYNIDISDFYREVFG